jgi:hypothetical protein
MQTNQILKGPFTGVSFQENAIYERADPEEPGQIEIGIRLQFLTQAFLDKFNPKDGWSVQIGAEPIPFDMFPMRADANGQVLDKPQPTMRFVATLTDPNQRIVATASTVWVIDGPTAYERGETNARLRLYEAAGLPTKLTLSTPVHAGGQVRTRASNVTTLGQAANAKPKGYTLRPVEEETKAPAAAAFKAPVYSGSQGQDGDDAAEVADEGSGSPEASETPTVDPTPAAEQSQPEAPAGDASEVTSRKPKAKRERAKDSDPAPQALLRTISRLCKLRGLEVPVTPTAGEAKAFLASLEGG